VLQRGVTRLSIAPSTKCPGSVGTPPPQPVPFFLSLVFFFPLTHTLSHASIPRNFWFPLSLLIFLAVRPVLPPFPLLLFFFTPHPPLSLGPRFSFSLPPRVLLLFFLRARGDHTPFLWEELSSLHRAALWALFVLFFVLLCVFFFFFGFFLLCGGCFWGFLCWCCVACFWFVFLSFRT